MELSIIQITLFIYLAGWFATAWAVYWVLSTGDERWSVTIGDPTIDWMATWYPLMLSLLIGVIWPIVWAGLTISVSSNRGKRGGNDDAGLH